MSLNRGSTPIILYLLKYKIFPGLRIEDSEETGAPENSIEKIFYCSKVSDMRTINFDTDSK